MPEQFPLLVHCTHCDVAVLQMGASAGHCALLVQPATHRKSPVWQMGVVPEQSELARHCTHSLLKQIGAPDGQSEAEAHCTQVSVVGSQIFASVGHIDDAVHWTHAPPGAQTGSSCGQAEPVGPQAAWQVCAPSQQIGVDPVPQSEFCAHCTHSPCRQMGAADEHCELSAH